LKSARFLSVSHKGDLQTHVASAEEEEEEEEVWREERERFYYKYKRGKRETPQSALLSENFLFSPGSRVRSLLFFAHVR
jgi:hypothetical protein